MAFSYEPENLEHETEGPLMRARLILGDTREASAHLQDEEIEYFLKSRNFNVELAVIDCAEAIATAYSHEVTHAAGSMRLELGSRAERWRKFADQLRRKTGGGSVPKVLNAPSVDRSRDWMRWQTS